MRIRVDIGPFEDGDLDKVTGVMMGIMRLAPASTTVPVVTYISDEEPPRLLAETAA